MYPQLSGDSEVPKKYFRTEVQILRDTFLHERLVAHVAEWFDRFPELRSCMFLVAQYWADNAWDEVHTRLVFSELSAPDARSALTETAADAVNLATNPSLNIRSKQHEIEKTLTTTIDLFDDDAIPMFAAYCREGSHQDEDEADRLSPCALLVRAGDGSIVVDVWPQLRPWLDGVALASTWDDAANRTDADLTEDQFTPRWVKERRDKNVEHRHDAEP